MTGDDAEFSDFVRANWRSLVRAAWLLTGDRTSAEDLAQAALAHTWARWRRIRSKDAAAVYVRRVMVTTFLGWQRRRWTGEVASGAVADRAASPDELDGADLRAAVIAAVRTLPPHQRAVVALRYLDDLSESATAEVLGCSVGAVKSQASRALAKLRATPGLEAVIMGEKA